MEDIDGYDIDTVNNRKYTVCRKFTVIHRALDPSENSGLYLHYSIMRYQNSPNYYTLVDLFNEHIIFENSKLLSLPTASHDAIT